MDPEVVRAIGNGSRAWTATDDAERAVALICELAQRVRVPHYREIHRQQTVDRGSRGSAVKHDRSRNGALGRCRAIDRAEVGRRELHRDRYRMGATEASA